ncbi:hypothetical protein FRB94_002175 [Tulasnella sp. JGI-2019a]|nr:hypothetical protein FRB94_002175 [Tulasnella sp. JGI-2019a]KAG8989427.1 hypothetical protein FRB93_003628 [Tulasnella sp. JGI-2019a]
MPSPDCPSNPFTTEGKVAVVSPALTAISRAHPKYDDELVNLTVENQIYRVSRILLSQSVAFSAVLGSHPSDHSIPLIGVSTAELESFLEVLHARQTEAHLRLQPAEWGDALHLSTKWGFSAVRETVIRRIEHQCKDQGTMDRFELAVKCQVPQWLCPVYHSLCTRNEYITADEGRRLGYERLTAICRIREILRDIPKLNEREERCERCDNCVYTELPCRFPLEASGADALQWINKAEHLKAFLHEEDIAVTNPIWPTGVSSDRQEKCPSPTEEPIPVSNIETHSKNGPLSSAETILDPFDTVTIEVTHPPTPINPVTVDSSKRSPQSDELRGHVLSMEEPPPVPTTGGDKVESSPIIPGTPLDVAQNLHGPISEYIEPIRTDTPPTIVGIGGAHLKLTKSTVVAVTEVAPLQPVTPVKKGSANRGQGK